MDPKLLEAIDAVIGTKVGAVEAKLSDVVTRIDGLKPVIKAEVDGEPVEATLEEAGALAGVMKTDVMGVPIGQAAVGGFVAVFATELIDGMLAKQSAMTRGVIKLAGAGVSVKYGKKILGDTGSKAVALLMAFDGLRDIVPLDTYAQKVAGTISGKVATKGLAQGTDRIRVLDQASKVATDYYDSAFGR